MLDDDDVDISILPEAQSKKSNRVFFYYAEVLISSVYYCCAEFVTLCPCANRLFLPQSEYILYIIYIIITRLISNLLPGNWMSFTSGPMPANLLTRPSAILMSNHRCMSSGIPRGLNLPSGGGRVKFIPKQPSKSH